MHNLFITYIEKINSKKFPKDAVDSSNDLQLVTLAALADIMPMQNENRIFVKSGIHSINKGKTRYGIAELLARLNLVGKPLNSTDISWKLIPVLNAAGRFNPSDCIVIGDSLENDVYGPYSAGMDAYYFDRGKEKYNKKLVKSFKKYTDLMRRF